MVEIRRRVDSKKRPQSVSIKHLQLCDLWGSGKGNLSKRKWHQHKKTWWFTQSEITPFHRHLAVLLSQELDRWVPPLGIMGRKEKSQRKHLYTNDSRKKAKMLNKKLSLLICGYQFSLLWFWKHGSWLDCSGIVPARAGGVREEGIRRKGTICCCLLISRPL